jgi:hypothetical protein
MVNTDDGILRRVEALIEDGSKVVQTQSKSRMSDTMFVDGPAFHGWRVQAISALRALLVDDDTYPDLSP